VAPDGRLYVAEFLAGRITAIEPKNGSKRMIARDLSGPLAVAVIGETLYVAESRAGRVSRIDLSTGARDTFLSAVIAKPAALGVDPDGSLLVLDAATRRLYRADTRSGALALVAENLPVELHTYGDRDPVDNPVPMAVSPSGDVYLGGAYGSLIKLEKSG
jgi:sugar lactone lactonase YvrE